MPITPWTLGQTRPIWSDQVFQDPPAGGGAAQPLNITAATITIHGKATDTNGNPIGGDLVGSGSVTITDALNGKFTYQPASTDFFVQGPLGLYLWQWKIDYGGGAVIFSDPAPINVVNTL